MRLILVFALLRVACAAASFTGTVRDPSRLAVPGAHVTLACGSRARSAETDAQGRFEFVTKSMTELCKLSVRHPGFAPLRKSVGPRSGSLTIQLALAPVRQAVEVKGQANRSSPLLRTSITSVSLSDEDLRGISNNTVDLIRYAKLLAGAIGSEDAIYVDGLPASNLPPAELVGRITVNFDPFSAEFADGDRTHIDIVTKSPRRDFRFTFGGGSLGAGGQNTLNPGLRSDSSSGNWGLSGSVPSLPLVFSIHMNIGFNRNDVPLLAAFPAASSYSPTHTASTANRNASGSINADYSISERVRAHFSCHQSQATGSNLGVGGLTLPDAGSGVRYATHEARGLVNRVGERILFESGLMATVTDSATRANSGGLAVTVPGEFVTGGAQMTASHSTHSAWAWKNVLRPASGRPWSAGVIVSGSDDRRLDVPNAQGTLEFSDLRAYESAVAGSATGTWLVSRGNGNVRYSNFLAAPFVQSQLLRTEHLVVNGGIRTDYQEGVGMLLSPRVSMAKDWHGFVVRAGGGVFARNIPISVFMKTIEGDPFHLQEFLVTGVSFEGIASVSASSDIAVHSKLAPDLSWPRELMTKASAERSFGRVTPALEWTWTRGDHLLGSRRIADGTGWTDIIESNRGARKQRLHAQVRYLWKRQILAAHYEWIRSRDDTSGPFSFPEQQDSLRGEWARSAGISPQNVSLAGSFRFPGALSVTVMEAWRSSAPYNVETGLDIANDGLFNDRGGLPRNSGNGPAYNSLAIYGYRRVALPHALTRRTAKAYMDIGVHADNLLGNRNYAALGSVLGSSSFGRPLAGSSGRSVRVWLNLN